MQEEPKSQTMQIQGAGADPRGIQETPKSLTLQMQAAWSTCGKSVESPNVRRSAMVTQAAQCLAKCCAIVVLPSTARRNTCHTLAENVIQRVDAEEGDEENQAAWGHGRHQSGGMKSHSEEHHCATAGREQRGRATPDSGVAARSSPCEQRSHLR